MGPNVELTGPSGELAVSLPWHVGFHSEITDAEARYRAVRICAHDGRHVAWACSAEHAALITEAVNKMADAGRSREGA